jgi:peptidoglycan/LPS O-acetylase OafA/YrhL
MKEDEFVAKEEIPVSASRGVSRRQDVPALTGLRFIAAFSVLIGHGFSWILQSHEAPWGFFIGLVRSLDLA